MVAAIVNYVRASDTQTGYVLSRARLPAGGRATRMSYRSTTSGRPSVVVVPGGHDSLGTKLGDDVIKMLCQSEKFERVQAFVAVRSHQWRARRLLEPPPPCPKRTGLSTDLNTLTPCAAIITKRRMIKLSALAKSLFPLRMPGTASTRPEVF